MKWNSVSAVDNIYFLYLQNKPHGYKITVNKNALFIYKNVCRTFIGKGFFTRRFLTRLVGYYRLTNEGMYRENGETAFTLGRRKAVFYRKLKNS